MSLRDSVPGALGFVAGAATASLLELREHDATLSPRDTAGALAHVRPDPAVGLAAPPVVDAFTGRGRAFGGAHGWTADDPGARLLLTRSLTVWALLAWDRDGQLATGGPGTIASRGDGSQPSEYRTFTLRVAAAGAGRGQLRLSWQDLYGVVHSAPSGEFRAEPGRFALLVATREWLAGPDGAPRVAVRYYADDRQLAAYDLPAGAARIGGGVGARVTIGARQTAPGVYTDHLAGILDQLHITADAATLEQVVAVYRRLAYWQPQTVEALRALQPPGHARTRDPGSLVQRDAAVAAQLLGAAAATADDLATNGRPDRAYGDTLAGWEALCGLARVAGEAIATRRARAVAALRRQNGYSLPALRRSLAPLLGVAPAGVELIEFTNHVSDDFGAPLDLLRWHVEGGGSVGTTAGMLRIEAEPGADLRPDPDHRRAALCLTPLADHRDCRAHVVVRTAELPATAHAGLVIQSSRGDALWYGPATVNGQRVIAYRILADYQLGPLVALGAVGPPPYWLRIHKPDRGAVLGPEALAEYVLAYSSAGAGGPFVEERVDTFPDPVRVGMGAYDTAAPTAATLRVQFDAFALWTLNADRPFYWYAFRDRALPGGYDLIGARSQIQRQGPARAAGSATTTKAIACDDIENGCDHAPLGGF